MIPITHITEIDRGVPEGRLLLAALELLAAESLVAASPEKLFHKVSELSEHMFAETKTETETKNVPA